MQVELLSLSQLVEENEDLGEIEEEKLDNFFTRQWWFFVRDSFQRLKMIHSLRQSVRRLSEDVLSEQVFARAEMNLAERLNASTQFGQVLSSSLPSLNLSFAHTLGACVCHVGAVTGNFKPGASFGTGMHVHFGRNGEKIYHDEKHHMVAPGYKMFSHQAGRIKRPTAVSPSRSPEYSGVSLLPSIKLFMTQTVGAKELLIFGPQNSVGIRKLLPFAS
jgi:hypothetical protein